MKRFQIAAPRMRLSFGDEGLPLAALANISVMVGTALAEHGLVQAAAECTVTNTGTTIHLLNPQGEEVWTSEITGAT